MYEMVHLKLHNFTNHFGQTKYKCIKYFTSLTLYFFNRGTKMSFSSKLFIGALTVSAFAFAVSAQDQPTKRPDASRGERAIRGDRDGQGPRDERVGRPGGPGEFGLRGIELTDAQKEQIRQIREANRPSEALMTEMRTLHEAKRSGTITADQEARLKALAEEGRQKGESVHEQVLNVLTTEQKAQLEQRKQEMKQRMEQRRQEMQERRQQRDSNRTKDTTKTTTTKGT